MMVAICGLKFIRFCWNESNQTPLDYENYMGEVSRFLVSSPRLQIMETFILIIFSSLVGCDAPYSVHFLKYYHLVFHYLSSDGCCSVVETLGYSSALIYFCSVAIRQCCAFLNAGIYPLFQTRHE